MTNINSTDLKARFDEVVVHLIMARQQLEDAEQAYFDNFSLPDSSQHWDSLSKELDNAKRAYESTSRIVTDFILIHKDEFKFE